MQPVKSTWNGNHLRQLVMANEAFEKYYQKLLCCKYSTEAIYIAYYYFLLAYDFNIFFLEAKLGLIGNLDLLNTIAICMTDNKTFTSLLLFFTPECRMSSVISKIGFIFLDQGFPKLFAPVCILISVCCSGTGFYYQVFWRVLLYTMTRTVTPLRHAMEGN